MKSYKLLLNARLFCGFINFLIYIYQVRSQTTINFNYMPCSEDGQLNITCTDATIHGLNLKLHKGFTTPVTNCSTSYDRMSVTTCANTTLVASISPVSQSDNGPWLCQGQPDTDDTTINNEVFPHNATIYLDGDTIVCQACGINDTRIDVYQDDIIIPEVEIVTVEPCIIENWEAAMSYVQERRILYTKESKSPIIYGCQFGLQESFSKCTLPTKTIEIKPKETTPSACGPGCITGCVIAGAAVIAIPIVVFVWKTGKKENNVS